MTNRYEHPVITKILETGYPGGADTSKECPWCGGNIEEVLFSVENDEICVECFKDYIRDMVSMEPKKVAALMRIDTARVDY